MKALYIGYAKTGTKTMNIVFRTLGYKSYDFPENYLLLQKDWTKILEHGSTPEDFKRMYEDVDSCVDALIYSFWEEILKAYPDTKLLVSYRDDETWLRSFFKQIEEVAKDRNLQILSMLSPTAQRFLKMCRLHDSIVWGGCRGAWPWEFMNKINKTLMMQRYKQHNLYVQKMAPKGQLHVVDFKKGWGPICEFLGEPIPEVPFPHANKAGELYKEYMDNHPIFKKMKREAAVTIAVIITFISVGLYFIFLS